MIRNIVFDIGNVLTLFDFRGYIKDLGFDKEMGRRLAKATVHTQAWHEFDRGVWSDEQVLHAFIATDPEIETQIRLFFANLHGIVKRLDYAIPWIKALKGAGYQVYFLSNFAQKIGQECADALDFVPYMDGGVFSCDVKLIKPEAAIYEKLLQQYGLLAEECLFVDDLERNVVAAEALGFATILFTSKEDADNKMYSMGVRS